jgi:hypothetical protein
MRRPGALALLALAAACAGRALVPAPVTVVRGPIITWPGRA